MNNKSNQERIRDILCLDDYYEHTKTGCIKLGSDWAYDAKDWEDDLDSSIEDQSDSFLKKVYRGDLYEMYDEMIDEITPWVDVMGGCYEPSKVLKNVDSILYEEGFHDYVDSLAQR